MQHYMYSTSSSEDGKEEMGEEESEEVEVEIVEEEEGEEGEEGEEVEVEVEEEDQDGDEDEDGNGEDEGGSIPIDTKEQLVLYIKLLNKSSKKFSSICTKLSAIKTDFQHLKTLQNSHEEPGYQTLLSTLTNTLINKRGPLSAHDTRTLSALDESLPILGDFWSETRSFETMLGRFQRGYHDQRSKIDSSQAMIWRCMGARGYKGKNIVQWPRKDPKEEARLGKNREATSRRLKVIEKVVLEREAMLGYQNRQNNKRRQAENRYKDGQSQKRYRSAPAKVKPVERPITTDNSEAEVSEVWSPEEINAVMIGVGLFQGSRRFELIKKKYSYGYDALLAYKSVDEIEQKAKDIKKRLIETDDSQVLEASWNDI